MRWVAEDEQEKNVKSHRGRGTKGRQSGKTKVTTKHPRQKSSGRSRRSSRIVKKKSQTQNESDEEAENEDRGDVDSDENMEDDENNTDKSPSPNSQATFPVILTTYDILMRDRPFLEKYKWGYIVVDEGTFKAQSSFEPG
jgi:ATP-dependent DNA helicase